jgi:CO/xanthine dehydrogenase Mo-binding subunit
MASATATKGTPNSKASKRASEGVVGVKELAAALGCDPRELRKFLRAQGVGVGFGSRYQWPSMADAAVKRIVREYEKAQQPPQPES